MPVLRDVHADGWRVRLDLSEQMLGLEVPEFDFGWCADEGKQPDAEPNEPPLIEFSGERHDFAVPGHGRGVRLTTVGSR